MADTLDRLAATIATRRTAAPDSSYTASLFAKGRAKIAQKLGEEAVETVIAALAEDRKALTGEAADLLYHLLVLLEAADLPLADVYAELDRREGVSGLAEKAARSEAPAPIAQAAPRPLSAVVPAEALDDHHATLAPGRVKEPGPRIRKG